MGGYVTYICVIGGRAAICSGRFGATKVKFYRYQER